MNLYVETEQLKAMIDQLLIEFPELAEDEELRADMFEGETKLHEILAALVSQVQDVRTMAEAIKIRKKELGERQARYERAEEGKRKLILQLMERADLKKLPLVEATLSTRNVPPGPMVVNEADLPDDCVTIVRKPNMAAIKQVTETRGMPPGVAMKNGYLSLTIRTK